MYGVLSARIVAKSTLYYSVSLVIDLTSLLPEYCNNHWYNDSEYCQRLILISTIGPFIIYRGGVSLVIGTLLNHELSLSTTVFGCTMLQRSTRTFNDARHILKHYVAIKLLTCLDLLCFKDPVEFSTACIIPTCTARVGTYVPLRFFSDDVCHAYVSDTHP